MNIYKDRKKVVARQVMLSDNIASRLYTWKGCNVHIDNCNDLMVVNEHGKLVAAYAEREWTRINSLYSYNTPEYPVYVDENGNKLVHFDLIEQDCKHLLVKTSTGRDLYNHDNDGITLSSNAKRFNVNYHGALLVTSIEGEIVAAYSKGEWVRVYYVTDELLNE